MKKLTRALPVLLLTALAACAGDGPEVVEGKLTNALRGEFGEVSADGDDAIVADLTRYSGAGWSSLNVLLTAPEASGGAVMGGVFLSNLELEELAPGTRIRVEKNYGYEVDPFREADIAILPEPSVEITGPEGEPINVGDDVWIDGIGCSGDVPTEWERDEPAEEIIIDVVIDEEGTPGVIVQLDFASGPDQLEVTAPLTNITELQDDVVDILPAEPALD